MLKEGKRGKAIHTESKRITGVQTTRIIPYLLFYLLPILRLQEVFTVSKIHDGQLSHANFSVVMYLSIVFLLLQNKIIGKRFLQAIAFNTTLGNTFLFSSENLTNNLEELILSSL